MQESRALKELDISMGEVGQATQVSNKSECYCTYDKGIDDLMLNSVIENKGLKYRAYDSHLTTNLLQDMKHIHIDS